MNDQQLSVTVAQLSRRVQLLEAKIDFLLKQLNIQFVEEPEPRLALVDTLVAQGNLIGAIKAYREATGADLATAKAYVEGLPQTK